MSSFDHDCKNHFIQTYKFGYLFLSFICNQIPFVCVFFPSTLWKWLIHFRSGNSAFIFICCIIFNYTNRWHFINLTVNGHCAFSLELLQIVSYKPYACLLVHTCIHFWNVMYSTLVRTPPPNCSLKCHFDTPTVSVWESQFSQSLVLWMFSFSLLFTYF